MKLVLYLLTALAVLGAFDTLKFFVAMCRKLKFLLSVCFLLLAASFGCTPPKYEVPIELRLTGDADPITQMNPTTTRLLSIEGLAPSLLCEYPSGHHHPESAPQYLEHGPRATLGVKTCMLSQQSPLLEPYKVSKEAFSPVDLLLRWQAVIDPRPHSQLKEENRSANHDHKQGQGLKVSSVSGSARQNHIT